MRAVKLLRNFLIPVTTMVLACFSNAVGQASYTVQDLGVEQPDNLGMAMGLNNHGGTLIMDQLLDHFTLSTSYPPVKGTVRINFNVELGTLGGENSSINWNGINDPGAAVGMSETSELDPNNEDLCGFGTHHICSPFLWQNNTMVALPTVGGNNGQASAINNSGQVAGYAENGVADSTCSTGTVNFMVDLPVMWDNGVAIPLPTIDHDPDGVAFGINDRGQAVGYSGTCIAVNHAVVWENGTATPLPNLGNPYAVAYAINGHNQVVGQAVNSGGTALAAIWQNHKVAALGGGALVPGDVASFATDINNQGQAVGSSFNSVGWSHGLLWQNDRMIDLNTVFPASSNLYVVNAGNINESGQIAGMAVEMVAGRAGTIVHAFLATPSNQDQGLTVEEVVRTRPEITMPAANVGKLLPPRSGHCSMHD